MKALMMEVDAAVTAAGQTLNECAFLGLPTAAFYLAIDQMPNAKAFHEMGYTPSYISVDDDNFFERLSLDIFYMEKPELRKKLSNIGRNLIDGKGVRRIVDLLTA